MITISKKILGVLHLGVSITLLGCCNTTEQASHAIIPHESVFATPDQAVDAFISATRNDQKAELIKILGPQSGKLIHSGDPVADRKWRTKFVAAYDKAHALESESNGSLELVVGEEQWPMPIPLIDTGNGWQWDTVEGEQEILNRRIGRSELNVIEVARAYVEAQRNFAEQHKLYHHQHEYARHFLSTDGKHDGLYWPVAAGEQGSPLGSLIAKAEAEGYPEKAGLGNREPYHGYYYKILTRQGPNAAGGQESYVRNGHMTRGYALIAFPARYGDSGVMTFIVNQNGIVYEKNFGPGTARIAAHISTYDPDSSWSVVP